MKFIDDSEKPRTSKEIKEAVDAIQKELMFSKPAPIMVFYPLIIECLNKILQQKS